MRRSYFLVVALCMAFLLTAPVLADSTQQYNKIYLSPFYVSSLTNNKNVSFLVTVNPPDKISQVASAIINFQVYSSGQTVVYTLWANGKACNTQSFTVTTSVSTSGMRSLNYDCSNIISKAGTYNITLRPSGASEGATTGWLEITYLNNPQRKIDVHGTEYVPYENGTVFVQVLDNNQGVFDAICDLTVFYPDKTYFIDTSMAFLNVSNGLYYHDFAVPNVLGVYMLESSCYVPVQDRGVNSTYYGRVDGDAYLVNSSGLTDYTYSYGTVGSGNEECSEGFIDIPEQFGGNIRTVSNITSHYLFLDTGGASPLTRIRVYVSKENTQTALTTNITILEANYTLTGTPTSYLMPNYTSSIILGQHELLKMSVCVSKTGSAVTYFLRYGSAYPSNFTRGLGGINISHVVEYRGSGEIHVSEAFTGNLTFNVSANVNLSQILMDISEINSTTTATNVLAIEINTTTSQTNLLAQTINATVIAINDYLNGFVTSILTSINQTVTAINGKEFSPNITVNTTFSINVTNVTVLVNTTNTTVVINVTNTTVVENITNTTVIVNTTQVNLINLTVVENLTNTTVIVNVTNTTVVVNTTQVTVNNITVVENITNTTVVVNTTQVNLINLTVVENITNTTVVINVTNTTVVVNTTNVTFSPVVNLTLNQTLVANVTVNLTVNVTELNSTLNEILGLSQQINQTTIDNQVYLVNINDTVALNSAQLQTILGLVTETNQTTHEINLTTHDIYSLLLSVNSTVSNISVNFTPVLNAMQEVNATTLRNEIYLQNINQSLGNFSTILDYLNNINGTVQLNQQTLSQLLGIAYDTNSTVFLNRATLLQLVSYNQEINVTTLTNLGLLQELNSTTHMNEGYLQQINQTTIDNNVILLALNFTTNMNNALLATINTTVSGISDYLNGFVTTSLNSIYALLGQVNTTTLEINSKDFNPNITINLTEIDNVTNVIVVVNTTNTTVVENITNLYPIFNVTNVTYVDNNTFTTVIINTTNTTVVENITNLYPIFNMTNVTYVDNNTFTTVIVNVTNTTYVANITVNNSIVFGGNITVNATAVVNTTQLINDILNAQITETIL